MSKKDKKIEIQVADAKVNVGKDSFEGYTLTIGKKVTHNHIPNNHKPCHKEQPFQISFSIMRIIKTISCQKHKKRKNYAS